MECTRTTNVAHCSICCGYVDVISFWPSMTTLDENFSSRSLVQVIRPPSTLDYIFGECAQIRNSHQSAGIVNQEPAVGPI